MAPLQERITNAVYGYSVACIVKFADAETREMAEDIFTVLTSFSERLPSAGRSAENPVEKLGEKACGRIVYRVMHGRPIGAAGKYESSRVKFEGAALGIVAAIAMGGLGHYETMQAERSLKFLIDVLEGKNSKVVAFSAQTSVQTLHPLVSNFFKTNIGDGYEYDAGITQGLKYCARKKGDEIRIFHIEPLEDKFFKIV